ncbi:ubiquitin-like autophagy protein Apg12-domain-containing protein [Tuber indicum]|nr:ubiquitin-like autophagy protein Apg12-domain-containing protein [Tuber indicum]
MSDQSPASVTPPPAPSDPPKIPSSTSTDDLPVALSASLVLTSLPRDGKIALDKALHPRPTKINIRFKPIGSAPALDKAVYKIKTSQRFENVVKFLRDSLGLRNSEGIFLYVNSTFAPGGDENVGNLWNCFRVDDQLIVSYAMNAAFG